MIVGWRKRGVVREGIRNGGFSLIELVVVVTVVLILAAMAIPSVAQAMYLFKLRNACTEFTGLVQQGRSRSVQDSRFYSIYVNSAGNASPNSMTEAFVNIYPQNADGTSGYSQGATIDFKDPVAAWSPDVKPQPQASAPSTSALKAAFLPTGTTVVPTDGSLRTSPITFSPMGVPCIPASGVCNASSGAVAYWVFFQNSQNQHWEAVTVTPAGKIQKWSYTGVWGAL